MLSPADLRTRVTVRDYTHALDTFGDAHLFVKDMPVGGKIHAADIVGSKRDVFQLNPRLTFTELILNAGSIVGKHLADSNIPGSLSHTRRGAYQHHTAEQKSVLVHVVV